MNCDTFRAGHLEVEAGEGHRDHLAECARCRADLTDLDVIAHTIADRTTWEEPAHDLGARVVSAIGASAKTVPKPRRKVAWAVGGLAVAVAIAAAAAFAAS